MSYSNNKILTDFHTFYIINKLCAYVATRYAPAPLLPCGRRSASRRRADRRAADGNAAAVPTLNTFRRWGE